MRGENASPTPAPPMIGASAAETSGSVAKRRPKIRFGSEISNSRQKQLAVNTRAEAAAAPSVETPESSTVAIAAATTAGPPYPSTTPQFRAASAFPELPRTQRLPAVQ